ncbi:MAG: prepilin-type N-terminal cleavage/methylation domain-containing protein [Candidatus Pacebacteria bacterium]|nr:prepilin-type N-terminal cleavage/methylation domain-containing protein [Candidatus Paceibacterota bacterium]
MNIVKSQKSHAKGQASHAKGQASFTLVELLIVIGILAVMSAVVVLVLKPDQIFKQARDTQRMLELQDINKALNIYQSLGGTSLGTATNVYVSLPGTDGDTDCDEYSLPALAAGYSYYCSTTANYRKIDGTGWIPVNLTTSAGSLFSVLPIDPVNTTTNGFYYTYMMGGSWELNALLESTKYRMGGSEDAVSNDGGDTYAVYEVGTDKTLSQVSDSGLTAYWKFEEGSGTLSDSSGNGRSGTQSGGVTYGATGKIGSALNFDYVDDYVDVGSPANIIGSSGSVSVWVKPDWDQSDGVIHGILNVGQYNVDNSFLLWKREAANSNNAMFTIRGSDSTLNYVYFGSSGVFTANTWTHIVATWETNSMKVYVNGTLAGTPDSSCTLTADYSAKTLRIGYEYHGASNYFDGIIDDVRFYNRVLSAAEAKSIYNSTK